MKIGVSDPGFWFAFFYVLSFAVTFLLVLIFSRRLKIPLWSVLLMLTAVSLCTIVGSRLTSVPVSDWGHLISSGNYEGYQGRFAVGGLLFGLAGLVFSQKYLGLGKQIYSVYAWIAPIGLGIQKIGCFLNGCCYGKPTHLPWGIQYPAGTSAHFHQLASGLISDKGDFSLGVIPVQLIEMICLFCISYIVLRTQKLWKKTGSSLIFSLSLFFVFRFFIGFVRELPSAGFDPASFAGLSVLQWFFLAAGIACAIILTLSEKYIGTVIPEPQEGTQTLRKSLLYVLLVSVIIYLFRGLFTPFELLSLDIKFIPAILLTAFYVYKSLKAARFQLATTSFFVVPLFLISQTLIPDSTKSVTLKDFYKNEVKSYKRIDAGLSLGQYYNTVFYNPHQGECGTTYSTEDYSHLYRMGGAGYSVIKKKGKSITTQGINLYGGSDKEKSLTSNIESTRFLFGLNPYIKYDLNWLGMGAGIHAGNLRWAYEKKTNQVTNIEGSRFLIVLPEAYLRVGRRDIADLKYTYGFNFPTSLPVLMSEISIGSGFGYKTDFSFRVGKGFSMNDSYTFISAEGLINKQFGISFKYYLAGDNFYSTSNSQSLNRTGRALIGLNYRFGFEK